MKLPREHLWVDAAGQPWSLKSKSDLCATCSGTPDTHPYRLTTVPCGDCGLPELSGRHHSASVAAVREHRYRPMTDADRRRIREAGKCGVI